MPSPLVAPPVTYTGRFAPSPTGPLHMGSLIAALASFLDARHHHGRWLLRMEDLDPPREEPGAAQDILHSLQCHGLAWDGKVLFQSTRLSAYTDALQTLAEGGYLFCCACTRALLGAEGTCRGRCAERQSEISMAASTRARVPHNRQIQFVDQILGVQSCDLSYIAPNFVVKRKDGLTAYQMAVVVDDAYQGVTHVVRGSDLLDSTARQIFLQQALSYPSPVYCHVPLITTSAGQKFSKQNHAPRLDGAIATDNLRRALRFLGQQDPPTTSAAVAPLLQYAIAHWSIARVPARLAIPASVIGPTP